MVAVVQGQKAITGAKDARPNIFTKYQIEKSLVNGRVHYTSVDGTIAIAYGVQWTIQPVRYRYWFYWITFKCRVALIFNSFQGHSKRLGRLSPSQRPAPRTNRPHMVLLWQGMEGCKKGPWGEMYRSVFPVSKEKWSQKWGLCQYFLLFYPSKIK